MILLRKYPTSTAWTAQRCSAQYHPHGECIVTLPRLVNFIHRIADSQQCGNDGTGAGAEYQIETRVESGTPEHGFGFFQDTERVEALCVTVPSIG